MIENAKWIWADVDSEVNQYVDFLLEFEVDNSFSDAYIEICSDKDYAVWINGTFVGCGQYHDYPSNKCFDTLKIGDALVSGKNRLCITGYYQGVSSMQYAKSVAGICFALCIGNKHLLSNEQVLAAKSVTYTSGEFYKTTNQLGFGYGCDTSKYDGWLDNNVDVPERFKAAVYKEFNTVFKPRPLKKLVISDALPSKVVAQGYFSDTVDEKRPSVRMQRAFLSHRPFDEMSDATRYLPGCIAFEHSDSDGYYIIVDLGSEKSGYLSVDVTADEGTLVDIGYGEHLEDVRVRTAIEERNFTDTVICGRGRTRFTHWFKRVAGRYIQLHIHTKKTVTVYYAGMLSADYPINETSMFWCNDHLHNKIYKTCIDTLKLCMHEHYEDCPWREQALYCSDSRNQILGGYYAFGEYEFPRQSLGLLGDSFGDDGFQTICAPTDEKEKIPSFTLIWFLEIKEYIQYSGDDYFVREYWNVIENAFSKYFTSFKDGYAAHPLGEYYWDFYEWSEGHFGIEEHEKYRADSDFYDGLYQMFLYLALKNTLWIAERYKKESFLKLYKPMADELKTAINKKFWNEERTAYAAYIVKGEQIQYGELAQAIAVYSGIADEAKSKILCKILSEENDLVKITLSYSLYKYEALLMQGGKYDKVVFDEIAKRWGAMLYSGATSFWETDGGADDFKLAGSLCHGWSGFPVYLYYRYVAGITPEMLNGSGDADARNVFAEFECRCGNIRDFRRLP